MRNLLVLLFVLIIASGFKVSNHPFMAKFHKVYQDQLKSAAGKTFSSKMVKKNYAVFIYNYPELDEFKTETCTEFVPTSKAHTAYTLKMAIVEKDNAKEILKTLKKNLEKIKSDKKTIKDPLLLFRNGKSIYVVSYGCSLNKTETEKKLLESLKEEAPDDWIIFNCGGSWELK